MLAKFLAACGYAKPDDIVDFVMTGVAVAPIVVGFGSGFEDAFGLLLVMLPAALMVFPWSRSREEIRLREEEDRAALLRQLTGKDR
ncbi:MAG: hypothetical protein HZB40_04270 [Rhodocyclales bacterium]|nr:hypothetical protein [Rhodocyclales bacterium]